jgi:hypothetical protein
MKLRVLAASLGLALPMLAGCHSDEALNAPDLSNNNGLFERYVSMGNSITAGFQSAGINDSTQLQSYAVLLASAAKAPFFVPLLGKPGCPAPFIINVNQTRLGNTGPTACALRSSSPLLYVSNVAVPGVTSFGVGSNSSPAGGTNQLTQFILGGRTQVKAMMDAQPTFVSAWIGNNDVLGALTNSANPGNPQLVTPEAAFEANLTPIYDSIAKVGAKAILIGVADVTAIPYASSGATYWCLKTGACPGVPQAPLPPNFTVNNNCAPMATGIPGAKGDSVLVPWTVGVPKISAAAKGTATTVDCTVDNEVVLPAEYKVMRDAVAGFNAFISAQATQHNWAYVDPNPILLAYRADPTKIAPFPSLPTGPSQPNVLFGSFFSLDGVHPSAAAHRVVADSLIAAINKKYGTTIPFVGP